MQQWQSRWRQWRYAWPVWLAIFCSSVLLGGPGRDHSPEQRVQPFPGLSLALAQHTVPIQTIEWTKVAKAAMPAVVNISSSKVIRPSKENPSNPSAADPFFRAPGPRPEATPRREQSLGSGVIVSPDGYVLTNYHVIENADEIQVALSDRREFKARIVGVDPKTDLAVLSLQGQGFPILAFGDSDRVEVAEPVMAIGNPFGLDRTVTIGIVSALGRANIGIVDYEDFIQTDAAINPGNSGGALINARGELIGINTAIFSESGGYAGIGFAVPVNMARIVLNQIITYGRVRRGWLGVMIQELTPALARGLGIPGVRGILIADVADEGPASQAGLQREDVVVQFEGKPVDDTGHFRNLVAEATPGKKIALGILRTGRPQTVTMMVGELPETPANDDTNKPEPDQIGLATTDLTPDMAKRLGLPFDARGAVITDVLAGGRAQQAGLQPGDVIQEANHQPIRTGRDFRQALDQSREHDLVLVVKREGTTVYFAIERLH